MQLVEGSVHDDYRKQIIATDSAIAIVELSGMLKINEVGDSICLFKKKCTITKNLFPQIDRFL